MLIAAKIKDLSQVIQENQITEVWMIVRSLKALPNIPGVTVYHVPQLSPSPELFHKYCNEEKAGRWNEEAFQSWYVPQFIKEMTEVPEARMALNKLYNAVKKKNIAIVCYCMNEDLCHRSIVLGLMYGMYYSRGLDCNEIRNGSKYLKYFNMYTELKGVVNNEVESIPVIKQEYKTMGFTGPRAKKLWGYDKTYYTPLVEKLKERIKFYHAKYGTVNFITGGAQGFDQIAFWAVNSCKREGLPLRNILLLPFPGQETPWKSIGLFSQQEYRLMISLADEVWYCKDKKPNDKSSAVMALFYRNHCIVDRSDIIFSLFHDDSWKKENAGGGTGECLRYAAAQGKMFLQLDPQGLNMLLDLS